MPVPSHTLANFQGARPVIDPDDAAMLLIDHQSGLFQTVNDMPMPKLRAHAAALATMASLARMPVSTQCTSRASGRGAAALGSRPAPRKLAP